MDSLNNLLNRKKELEQLIKNRQEIFNQSFSEYMDELSMYDQHQADEATMYFEREKELGMLEMLQLELDRINSALNSYYNGSSAVCERCGQEIEERRLQRLPATHLCARCAQLEDSRKNENRVDYEIPADFRLQEVDIREGTLSPGYEGLDNL